MPYSIDGANQTRKDTMKRDLRGLFFGLLSAVSATVLVGAIVILAIVCWTRQAPATEVLAGSWCWAEGWFAARDDGSCHIEDKRLTPHITTRSMNVTSIMKIAICPNGTELVLRQNGQVTCALIVGVGE